MSKLIGHGPTLRRYGADGKPYEVKVDIDLDQELSDDDRLYLLDRDMRAEVAENDAKFGRKDAVQAPHPLAGALQGTEPAAQADRTGVSASSRVGEGSPAAVVLQPAEPATPSEQWPDDYDEWTNAQLRQELEARELPKSGNHAELVARLEQDDADKAEPEA